MGNHLPQDKWLVALTLINSNTILDSSKCIVNGVVGFDYRILNKLTPDKFDKLCNELLGVGIETKYILKGVILLVS